MWHHATIRGILANLTYTGVLRCGESRSETLPKLQIISTDQYEAAQEIRLQRALKAADERTVPLNTKGQSLLAGNVYCAHCGARLALTTSGKYRRRADGTLDNAKRIRYICYGKTRKQTDCDGQTGYTQHILDGMVDELVKKFFKQLKGTPRTELVVSRYEEEISRRKLRLSSIRAELNKADEELALLKSEVVKCIKGESEFSKQMLSDLIAEAEDKRKKLENNIEQETSELEAGQELLNEASRSYDELISWAEMYDTASIATKKMIIAKLIRRIEVGRDYKLNVEFNVNADKLMVLTREDVDTAKARMPRPRSAEK